MFEKGAVQVAEMKKRLIESIEEAFSLYETTIAAYEEELCRSKEENKRIQQLLDSVLNPRVLIPRPVQIHQSRQEMNSAVGQDHPTSSRDAQNQTWSVDSVDIKQEPVFEDENIQKVDEGSCPVEERHGEPERIPDSEKRSLSQQKTSQSPVRSSPEKWSTAEKQKKGSKRRQKSKSFKCKECQKKLKGRRQLLRHSRFLCQQKPPAASVSESGSEGLSDSCDAVKPREKGFKCTECEKVFISRQRLLTHMGVHTNWKLSSYELVRRGDLYLCPVCNEGFRRKVDISRHFRAVHSKPFNCSMCLKKYTTEAALKKHALCHSGMPPFSCRFCSKRFVVKGRFMKHLQQHAAD